MRMWLGRREERLTPRWRRSLLEAKPPLRPTGKPIVELKLRGEAGCMRRRRHGGDQVVEIEDTPRGRRAYRTPPRLIVRCIVIIHHEFPACANKVNPPRRSPQVKEE